MTNSILISHCTQYISEKHSFCYLIFNAKVKSEMIKGIQKFI